MSEAFPPESPLTRVPAFPPPRGGTRPLALTEACGRRLFAGTWVATGGVKLVAVSLIPITGDEAHFFVRGRHLDYGYYDHGPMVGWWLAPCCG